MASHATDARPAAPSTPPSPTTPTPAPEPAPRPSDASPGLAAARRHFRDNVLGW